MEKNESFRHTYTKHSTAQHNNTLWIFLSDEEQRCLWHAIQLAIQVFASNIVGEFFSYQIISQFHTILIFPVIIIRKSF